MRNTKFRAWFKLNEQMMYYDTPRFNDHNCTYLTFETKGFIKGVDGEAFVLMQYTGLKEKNGKEIYEGDIVSNNKQSWKVSFSEFFARWELEGEKYSYDLVQGENQMGDPGDENTFVANCLEVIGNIYENPELLEPKSKGGEKI